MKILMEIYQTEGFEAIESFIKKVNPKVLAGVIVKNIPEAEPYLKLSHD